MPFRKLKGLEQYEGISFTTDKKTRGIIKLKYNIDPNNKKKCYVRKNTFIARKSKFIEEFKYSKFKVHNADKNIINNIIKKSKKK